MEAVSQESYGNDLMFQKFIDIIMRKTPDFNFIFEIQSEVVKIPAHKDILAASSPVFDAMFNGELKELGNVKIVDASPEAFKEFLQFFYEQRVQLSMNNIAVVLRLIDKYDVANCFPICVDFLKDHLKIDAILWGLHLSMKFKLDDLEAFCLSEIQENFKMIWNMFEIGTDGMVEVSPNPRDRFLSEEDTKQIFQQVFVISKRMVSSQSEIDRFHKGRVFSIVLVNTFTSEKITEREIIQFRLTGPMMLTDIFCSRIYSKREYAFANHSFEMSVEGNSKVLFSTRIELNSGENHFKFPSPIQIYRNFIYAIVMKSTTSFSDYYAFGANIPQEPVMLAPNLQISFPKVNDREYTRSLISHLCFEQIH